MDKLEACPNPPEAEAGQKSDVRCQRLARIRLGAEAGQKSEERLLPFMINDFPFCMDNCIFDRFLKNNVARIFLRTGHYIGVVRRMGKR
jgi:hypothetical protein